MDPYVVLGVPPHATAEEIRRAWVRLAQHHHPDRGGDAAVMQTVNEAWSVLGDPRRRAAWDREHGGVARWAAAPGGPAEPLDDLGRDPLGPDPFELLDDRSFGPPRRSPVDLAPAALFALSVAVGCLALVLDEPAMLGVAGFLFFLSCMAVGAVALLTMRRSVRAGRHR